MKKDIQTMRDEEKTFVRMHNRNERFQQNDL